MASPADEPDVVLIPIEDLGASGMTDACERRLLDRAIELFGVIAHRPTRGITRIIHVPATIDRELEPLRRSEGRHLVEDHLRFEIRRDQIGCAVGDEYAQLWIGGEYRAQVADNLLRAAPAAPIPARIHPAIEQLIRLLDMPIQRMRVEIGHRTGKGCAKGTQSRIVIVRLRRRWVGIDRG
jgi:hypothetical protein